MPSSFIKNEWVYLRKISWYKLGSNDIDICSMLVNPGSVSIIITARKRIIGKYRFIFETCSDPIMNPINLNNSTEYNRLAKRSSNYYTIQKNQN